MRICLCDPIAKTSIEYFTDAAAAEILNENLGGTGFKRLNNQCMSDCAEAFYNLLACLTEICNNSQKESSETVCCLKKAKDAALTLVQFSITYPDHVISFEEGV